MFRESINFEERKSDRQQADHRDGGRRTTPAIVGHFVAYRPYWQSGMLEYRTQQTRIQCRWIEVSIDYKFLNPGDKRADRQGFSFTRVFHLPGFFI